ncbi:putative bifunctional diguanylate cyclase/phosphodiesterase [Bacillus suaedae]|uniref:EAL domain-containing protein n=1 Tax=Halalkalibacter suaedae TaxID=2822140 RepID=A0A940X129_9BACI|nr:EAL domain-containing protein [Bacillus suaedae]MBP3953571.1 EAL domain-containing protein [Bacillus suaedae]
MTSPKTAMVLVIGMTVLFYGWIWFFSANELMNTLGAILFPIGGGIISFLWLFRSFRTIPGRRRHFWFFLSVGVFCYLSANGIWLFTFIVHGNNSYTDATNLLWMLAYFFYLFALIIKTKEIGKLFSHNPYLFNIIVLMIVATAICFHFLIEPTIGHSSNSIWNSLMNIAYPIIDLSILLVLTYLYYLSKYTNEKAIILFIIFGFLIQISADLTYVYLELHGLYVPGSAVDPLWVLAIMIIGYAGVLAQGHVVEHVPGSKETTNIGDTAFSYVSVLVLTVLVMSSYQWNFNTLSIGICIIFFMIIGRQFMIIRRNDRLVEQYRELAFCDSLTGLNNRTSFKADLDKAISQSRNRNSMVAVLLIDLDHFKNVNDTLGHPVGDLVLKETATRIKRTLDEKEKLYRLGGDEFIVVLTETSYERCVLVSEMMLREFSIPFLIANHEITITPSIGISSFPDNGHNGETLFKAADAAMYLAKESGRNKFRFYDSQLNEIMIRKVKIENELRKAIDRNELKLFYQPKINLYTREISGMEALLRWDHHELCAIPPLEFVPIAEETGQIVAIGEWVLREACKQSKAWHEEGFTNLALSVNVSVRQFQHSDFVQTVQDIIMETEIDPRLLELEITESIMQNVDESIDVLNRLRKLNIKTAIDDFGTGYSSLHILKNLPIDTIKIDKSFIHDIKAGTQQSLVKSIIDMGKNLKLTVVAEGVEHEHQAELLANYQCEFGQGYLFLKPVNAYDFERFLVRNDKDNVSKFNMV